MHVLTLPDPQKQRLPDDPVSGVGEECGLFSNSMQGMTRAPARCQVGFLGVGGM